MPADSAASMPDPLDLIASLTLERVELNLFRGRSTGDDGPRIFGGHVIAQGLLAMYGTVEDKVCHSLHAYFIRPGDVTIPVLYEVDRSRDGGSFATRRVTAIQNGRQIFNMAASFQTPQDGFEHQAAMPPAPDPESVPDDAARLAEIAHTLTEEQRRRMSRPRAIDIRWVDPQPMLGPPERKPAEKQVWMRARKPIGTDIHLQQAMLAYASDMAFMETAMRVHGLVWSTKGLQSASLDHAMWFLRPFDFNAWHLYQQDSPSTFGGRGLVRGSMFSRDGRLVASMAQDCLMRMQAP